MTTVRLMRLLAVAGLLTATAGCYYLQAAGGQLEVLRKREPLAEVIASPDSSEELVRRLRLIQEARQFSIDALGLPDNDSYRTYSDLERDFVLWNVFATPEFSLEPKRWCYWIVGCVGYRGYFSRDAADREAQRLDDRGFDVAVGGVAAYSTLGRFNDPVLNTMLRWDDIQLVSTLFHELAHQVLYIKDDTGFNESFATAVEEFGLERWLEARGRETDIAAYRDAKVLQQRLLRLVDAARDDLRGVYSGAAEAGEKRRLKSRRLATLAADVRAELERAGRDPRHWLAEDLNNAKLVPMALYEARVPAFRALFARCDFELDCFYAEVTALSKLDKPERDARLDALSAG